MDVDFLIQDTYALVRPQWKIATDLEDAGQLFSEAIAQNYKVQDGERPAEADEDEIESVSSDGNGDEGFEEDGMPDIEDMQSSAEEAEQSPNHAEQEGDIESEEEQIFVSRQEEERDPEVEAEFDRAFEKMMAESMEGRRFERKAMFDIPLPMRPSRREAGGDEVPVEEPKPSNTMAFSLMTKKGNRQQVRLTTCFFLMVISADYMCRHVLLSCRQILALQWR